uniref:AlNc14C37G3283 protein n=1 Tax=Albugo laibachii Nc14 TaxID=890382 RepID=F0W913_9STRA|nr:AlNc14C37G3283 [Albugo laibachii Nc14]|eukprot:CCA17624.1 AlNc14C37G3283 [Albugo laibachii Nc14]
MAIVRFLYFRPTLHRYGRESAESITKVARVMQPALYGAIFGLALTLPSTQTKLQITRHLQGPNTRALHDDLTTNLSEVEARAKNSNAQDCTMKNSELHYKPEPQSITDAGQADGHGELLCVADLVVRMLHSKRAIFAYSTIVPERGIRRKN